MVEENVYFICRAKNSFGLVETTTLVIAEKLGGIIYYLLLLQSFKNMKLEGSITCLNSTICLLYGSSI